MSIWKFKNWCDAAVSGIVFPPDRNQVHEELLRHLEDHYEDLLAQGLDPETAQQLALAAMGDANEIAPQLAAIHRPFWGYVLRVTRVALVMVLCASVIAGGLWLWHTEYAGPQYSVHPFRDTQVIQDDHVHTRIFYAQPNQSAKSDGYTITLTEAALWQVAHQDPLKEDSLHFYFQMEVFNPRPWAEHRDIVRWFWAVDSLGNTYDCFYDSIVNYAPYISGNTYHTAPLTYTHDMWISDYRSQDAEWIEFHYDRSGRNIVFRLDLTGGGAA